MTITQTDLEKKYFVDNKNITVISNGSFVTQHSDYARISMSGYELIKQLAEAKRIKESAEQCIGDIAHLLNHPEQYENKHKR